MQPRPLDLESVPPDLLVRGIEELVKEDGTIQLIAGDSIAWGGGLRMCMELAEARDCEALLTVETMGDDGLLIVPALFGISEGKGKLLGKMVTIGGMLWVWEKREPVKSDLNRIQPVDVPEPEPLR